MTPLPPPDPEWLKALLEAMAMFAASGSAFGVAICLMLLMRRSHSHRRKRGSEGPVQKNRPHQ